MTSEGVLPSAVHVQRAENHRRVGDDLLASGETDWASVCLFYSAYHFVRAALTADPVFDDIDLLHAINHDLNPDDRATSRHKGRKNGTDRWGVGELVLLLYKPIAGPYDRLHQASVDVRYRRGFRGVAVNLEDQINAIRDAYKGGLLIA